MIFFGRFLDHAADALPTTPTAHAFFSHWLHTKGSDLARFQAVATAISAGTRERNGGP
jgi:hypothetical protein